MVFAMDTSHRSGWLFASLNDANIFSMLCIISIFKDGYHSMYKGISDSKRHTFSADMAVHNISASV